MANDKAVHPNGSRKVLASVNKRRDLAVQENDCEFEGQKEEPHTNQQGYILVDRDGYCVRRNDRVCHLASVPASLVPWGATGVQYGIARTGKSVT